MSAAPAPDASPATTPQTAADPAPVATRLFSFKQRLGQARLPDDALESAAPEGVVERYGDGNGRALTLQLHDAMTAALAYRGESVPFENLTDFGA